MVNIITHIRSDSRRSLRRRAIIGSPPLCQTYDETAVTIDLLCTEAERLSLQYGAGADAPVTQDIKTVSDRLRIDNDVDGPIEVRDPLYRTG